MVLVEPGNLFFLRAAGGFKGSHFKCDPSERFKIRDVLADELEHGPMLNLDAIGDCGRVDDGHAVLVDGDEFLHV